MKIFRLPALSAAAAVAALAGLPSAQGDLDLSINVIQVNQAVQTNMGNTPQTAGRATMVRVAMDVAGAVPPGTEIDGLLRVFVGGVEQPDSPIYSDNGPMSPALAPSPAVLDDTLNFRFRPPLSNDVVLTVELNPAGPNQVFETDYANNTSSTPALAFNCKAVPELVYVPIDYRPGGGPTPNLPNPLLIEPGVGDSFIQGIYPGVDWDYRRSDAPSKLWTSSLSGSGSSLNNSLLVDLQMMNPQPAFIYGWIPGSLPYNGQAIGIPGKAAIGNTEPIRHQRTFAHEIGHLFGYSHNNTQTSVTGIDVEHHLNLTQSLPIVKSPGLKDIMSPGLITNQAWVWPGNYNNMYNNPVYNCTQPLQDAGGLQLSLLVAALWNRQTGTVELTDTLAFEGGEPTPTVPLAQADLVLRAYTSGQLVAELGLPVKGSVDSCAGADSAGQVLPIEGFVAVLPSAIDPKAVDRVVIVDPATGTALARTDRSRSAPQVSFTSPLPGAVLSDRVQVSWQGSDADRDSLRYYVRYSPDGERRVPLAANLEATQLTVELDTLPAPTPGLAFLELFATDGLNTSRARTTIAALAPSSDAAGGSAPTTHILTPDDGKQFRKAATVLLHSSGWDLEDRSLGGASIVWTSDVDGFIGTGRTTSVTSLSVGMHVISVTATDSGGQSTSDSTTISVTDRPLPGGTPVTCQTDLGFGGPGASVLELCGGDLSSGTTADLALSGAVPSQPAWLVTGFSNSPTPILGGTIVPVPVLALVSGATDPAGEWAIASVPGGGGPAAFYVQAVYIDLAEPLGFGISNAVQVDFLP